MKRQGEAAAAPAQDSAQAVSAPASPAEAARRAEHEYQTALRTRDSLKERVYKAQSERAQIANQRKSLTVRLVAGEREVTHAIEALEGRDRELAREAEGLEVLFADAEAAFARTYADMRAAKAAADEAALFAEIGQAGVDGKAAFATVLKLYGDCAEALASFLDIVDRATELRDRLRDRAGVQTNVVSELLDLAQMPAGPLWLLQQAGWQVKTAGWGANWQFVLQPMIRPKGESGK